MYSQREYKNLLKGKSKNYINENLEEFTSDRDFVTYFGKRIRSHIIKYSDLQNYKTITNLLPRDGSFKILLYEQSVNSGHWVLLLRYGDVIEYFDSYANEPNFPLQWSSNMNDSLDQRPEYLNNLLLNQDKFKVIYNKYPFQSEFNDSGTCGKHIILRLIKFKYDKMTLTEYQKFFKQLKVKYNLDNDGLITLLIPVGKE